MLINSNVVAVFLDFNPLVFLQYFSSSSFIPQNISIFSTQVTQITFPAYTYYSMFFRRDLALGFFFFLPFFHVSCFMFYSIIACGDSITDEYFGEECDGGVGCSNCKCRSLYLPINGSPTENGCNFSMNDE